MRSVMLVAAMLASVASFTQTVDPQLFSGMKWRSIGPWRGGRSVACSGVVGRPNEFYFGATGGGIWKSTNAGVDWTNVSDGFLGSSSIGALAVSPSNPDVVYAGTGEGDIRGNISHGDGIYKSTDAGRTWKHLGLTDTQNIVKIRVHPKDSNTVWVAALGHVYGPNSERGIYKTTDGGASWSKVLFVSERAGGISLSLDANNPNVLYAATWEVFRTPYSLSSGGPGSKLWKSMDGGANWKDISRNAGMPKGLLGKIGVSVSPADSNRVYAIVEALDGGIFRSNDAGSSWTLVNDSRNWRQRAWYYTHVIADTKNADQFYVLNVGMGKTTDGGKTITGFRGTHVDNHDMWIDPSDPKRIIISNDGGASVTVDGGQTWTEQDFPTAQFYHVSTDNAFPYRVLGAQQDNSTVRIASRANRRGITRDDWTSTAGGESGYVVAKPDDPEIVFGGSYGGFLEMQNHRTGASRDVSPWPDNPIGHGAEHARHRMQWTFPIVFSPHDPNVLFTCSQHVMKSTDMGTSWTVISPDLTKNDKSRQQPSGGPITKDNTGVEVYCTVFTFAESTITRGLYWAGSDDGLVHISRDSGATWERITPKGMPEWGLCSMIETSYFDAGTAYLAVDNHENDDMSPYIYRTRDFGKSWTKCVTGIPRNTFVRVVREDPKRKGLLYAGTETGVYVSFNDGDNWQPLQLNLPLSPIHDIVVKEDDLVVATHGRSFWILDDLSPLQQLTAAISTSAPRLFKPRDTVRVRWGSSGDSTSGDNPMSGVVANFYLPSDAEKVTFELADSVGEIVARSSASDLKAGLNKTSLWPQYPNYRTIPNVIMWAAFAAPIKAPPGKYTLKMTIGDRSFTQEVNFIRDPRNECSDADLIEQFQFSRRIAARVTEAHDALMMIRDARAKANSALEEVKKQNKNVANVTASHGALISKIEAVEMEIYQTKLQAGQDALNYPIKLNNKLAALVAVVQSGDGKPTKQSYEVFEMLSGQLQVQLDLLKGVWAKELAAFNQLLNSGGFKPIEPSKGSE